ncbi:MAG TPA: three-Cys-motif partner protein TcmP [Phycisphaerales bacterium]|nr:three-Cys-motif partner protein TcmP [Phycisphaerales bacterium]
MTVSNTKLDEINYWSEVKLDIIKKYAQAYSVIINSKPEIKKHLYIDGFSGAGLHISKQTGEYILGSPLNALNINPAFDEFHFIDLNSGKAGLLRDATKKQNNIYIYEADCNKILIEKVFPRARWSDFHRALCLLDPYGLHLDWQVMQTAGQMRSIEIFLNFPVMDMNRNVLWGNPDKVKPEQLTRMDLFWGDRTWKDAAYSEEQGLFEEIKVRKHIGAVITVFRKRLVEVAGFKYVPEPIPMRNNSGAIMYYLFFASPNKTGAKIVKDIYDKYRDKGVN